MPTYVSSRVKRKSFYRKSELRCVVKFFLRPFDYLLSRLKSSLVKRKSVYRKVNSRCFFLFQAAILADQNYKKLYKGASFIIIVSLLEHFIFLASSTARFPI